MDNATMAIKSAPLYHKTTIVSQNEQHFSHLAILPTTSAIASGNPRCTARVTENAIANIIHTISNRMLSSGNGQGQRCLAYERA